MCAAVSTCILYLTAQWKTKSQLYFRYRSDITNLRGVGDKELFKIVHVPEKQNFIFWFSNLGKHRENQLHFN